MLKTLPQKMKEAMNTLKLHPIRVNFPWKEILVNVKSITGFEV